MSEAAARPPDASGRSITYAVPRDDRPFCEYVLGLVSARHGLCFRPAERGEQPDIYYGPELDANAKLRIAHRWYGSAMPPPRTIRPAPGEDAMAVDPFQAIRFWLADEANGAARAEAFDVHERLKAASSAQARLGLLRVPIVNRYLAEFAEAIGAAVGIKPLELEGKATVILTHDADNPIDLDDWRHAAWRAGDALRRHRPGAGLRAAVSAGLRLTRKWAGRRRRNWVFSDLMEMEARHGYRSTVFFSARPRGEPGTGRFDEGYDIRDPRFGKLFRELNEGGWEIGLHSSYEARRSASCLTEERVRLSEAAEVRIEGNRHHYWHMARPFWRTLEDHAKAGFRYDSSVAFNERPGFRLGFAFPCHLWNPETESRVGTVQLPTMLMDGGYFYRTEMTVDEALADFADLLDQLKRVEGTAALNWHVRLAVPEPGPEEHWGIAYREILSILASDPDVDVTTGNRAAATAVA